MSFLEEHLAGAKRRIKRVASTRAISAGDWISGLIGAWDAAQDLVAHAVALSHLKPGWAVLVFYDASDEHWTSFLTPVPQDALDCGVSVEDMTHEPLGFLSATFKGSQRRWATVDKEGSPFKRSEYVLWNGVHSYTDQRNLAYIFDPEACVSSVAKTTAQRLDHWKAVLGQYDYTIVHIAGDRNCSGDLLSRWVTVSSVSVRATAVYAPSAPDETLPSKQVIWDARANPGTLASGATSFVTNVGQVSLGAEVLVRLPVDGRAVLWIPRGAKQTCLRFSREMCEVGLGVF